MSWQASHRFSKQWYKVFAHAYRRRALISETHRCMRGEGDIAAPLGQIADEFQTLSIGSYPFQQDGVYGTNIVVRGTDPAEINGP